MNKGSVNYYKNEKDICRHKILSKAQTKKDSWKTNVLKLANKAKEQQYFMNKKANHLERFIYLRPKEKLETENKTKYKKSSY